MTVNSAFSDLARRTVEPPISWLMKMRLERPELISLAAGFTDGPSLPVREARTALATLLESTKSGRAALQYGSTMGDSELRALTANRLRKQDGARSTSESLARYSADRIVLTHGSQQLLYLITECLCDVGDIVLVEDPTYFVFLGIAQSHGLRVRGIEMTADGIDLGSLERSLDSLHRKGELRRLKLLYLVSYFQNPSGVTTCFAKKEAALRLLRRYERKAGHPIFLLEDAAYRELRFAGEDVPSALAVEGAAERVLYAGTYSKPFATGVRVGFGLLPEAVRRIVGRVKGNHDFGTANLLQRLLATVLRSGAYDRHRPVMQERYRRKAGIMVRALQEFFPETVRWEIPAGGLYVWARLPRPIKTGQRSAFFKAVLKRNVLYVPGELCYADDPSRPRPNHEMRLSFGNAGEEGIREGSRRIGVEIAKFLKSHRSRR